MLFVPDQMSNICYSNGISLYCFSCRYMPVTIPFFYSFINDHPVFLKSLLSEKKTFYTCSEVQKLKHVLAKKHWHFIVVGMFSNSTFYPSHLRVVFNIFHMFALICTFVLLETLRNPKFELLHTYLYEKNALCLSQL